MVEKLSLDWLEDDKTVNSLEVIGMAIDYHFDGLDTEIVLMFFVIWNEL